MMTHDFTWEEKIQLIRLGFRSQRVWGREIIWRDQRGCIFTRDQIAVLLEQNSKIFSSSPKRSG